MFVVCKAARRRLGRSDHRGALSRGASRLPWGAGRQRRGEYDGMGTESAGMGGYRRGAQRRRRRGRSSRATRFRTRSGSRTPVTEVARYIVWFHNDILMPIITLISLFVLGAAGLRRLALQREGQSDAVEDHAQHADRGGLDGRAGHHSGDHRRAVVPAVDDGAGRAAVRPHDEGDGVAMALELRLSQGRRRLQFRLLHEGGKRV